MRRHYHVAMFQNGRRVQIRRQDLTWREVDGIVIALDLASSTYFTTNKSGRYLWHALTTGATVDELTTLLESTFGIPPERAADDVAAFLELLSDNNLIQA